MQVHQTTINKLVTLLGGIVLLGLFLSAWIPQPCPVLRKAIFGCPAHQAERILTPAETELERIPHQDVTEPNAIFSVKSQEYRATTRVYFYYRADLAHQTAVLRLRKKDNEFQDVALVTSPLLQNIAWPKSTEGELTLFVRNEATQPISDFLKNLPPANQLLVDNAAARLSNLSPTQYTPLEESDTLTDQIRYILTTYTPPKTNGTWREFSHVLDAGTAVPVDGQLQWMIHLVSTTSTPDEPFRIGTVHVDYETLH